MNGASWSSPVVINCPCVALSSRFSSESGRSNSRRPSAWVPHSRCVNTARRCWIVCRSQAAITAPSIGASRYTHRKCVCPETAAGPNWRAGFTLPPVDVPRTAMAIPIRMPTTQGTNGARRSSARHMPTINTMTAIDRVSAVNSSAVDHSGPGWSTAYTTGGSATTWPHTTRAASTPSTEPSNWAILYGTTPAAGKTPKRHMASEMAGFICPPDALPIGLRISPARSNATPAPTSTSSAWICGIDREMSEGPITHLTIVVTPKSRRKVRINS